VTRIYVTGNGSTMMGQPQQLVGREASSKEGAASDDDRNRRISRFCLNRVINIGNQSQRVSVFLTLIHCFINLT
jgi:hypothetical protein